MPELIQIPPLDALAASPRLADSLPPAAVVVLLGRANLAIAALQARLLAASIELPQRQRASDVDSADRTLNADEIAYELAVSRRWVFRHAKKLSFVKRVSRKSLSARLSEVRRWRETQAV
jgi:hypothetical protein